MDAQAVVSVSAAVLAITQFSKWSGIPDRYGPLAVLLLSAVGVVLWGWSVGDFERAKAFDYFAGWVAVATSAAGVWGFSRASGEALTKLSAPPGGAGSSPTIKSDD
jgi:hypothetical protein